MDTTRKQTRSRHLLLAALATSALLVGGCASRTPSAKPGTDAPEQRFSSPKAAVDALLDACRKNDEGRLVAIFGEQVRPFVSTGDPATDREKCALLLNAAKESTRLDPKGADTLQLVVGSDDWPFPIPLVKDGKSWRFDTAEGMKEVRRRRIGADELEAIRACHTYVLAQREHAAHARGAYARDLTGGRGRGLAWPSTGKESVAPLVRTDVKAAGQGPQATWRGYHYRILTSQGPHGPGGRRSYLAGGAMTRGFALVAYPIDYGWTGVMTFVVGPDGRVHQKDLGAQTEQLASRITTYDPDGTWTGVE